MKIIFLNTLGGKVEDRLVDFLKKQSLDTDVFCLQEVEEKLYDICASLFDKDYQMFFANKANTNEDRFDQMTLIKKHTAVADRQVLGLDIAEIGLGIYTKLRINNGFLNLLNVHGNARPGQKKDDEARLKQSKVFLEFSEKIDGPWIIGGDFNLDLNTESVKMFERNGYKNLIREYKIKTTRNHLIWDKYPDSPQMYADHLFVNDAILIDQFIVPKLEISDHEPMVLTAEI